MPTEQKARTIDDLAEKLRESRGAVLLDYRGLNVAQITDLRRQLNAEEVEFHVAKNTLLRIAAGRAKIEVSPELLEGPTAIAFGWRDEVTPARLLTDYARRNRVVEVKGGIMGNHSLTPEQVGRVATLPSREVLLAQLLGTVQAPLGWALGAIQAPAREVAGLAEALRAKREATGEAT